MKIKIMFMLVVVLCLTSTVSAQTFENVGGVYHFWTYTDIPALYAGISDNSVLSYNATEDIYTFHYPFYQNNSGDTFYFNESTHFKSNNDGSPAYFRWAGKVEFDYHTILSWDTASKTTAPVTDTTRAYIYSDSGASGNITNGDMSYLGQSGGTQVSGVCLDNFNNANISNNTFSNNQIGMTIKNSNNNVVNNNAIYNSNDEGLYLISGTGFHTVNNNAVYSNGIGSSSSGLLISSTDNSNFSNNTIYSNTGNGMYFGSSDYNNASNNTIYSNGKHGIDLTMSPGTTLIENNISDTTGIYYDYIINPMSTGTTIIDAVKTSNYYSISSISDPVTFQNGVDYNVYVTETTVIQDNPTTGAESVNISVVSGTVGQMDVSSLAINTEFKLYYSFNWTVIETQNSDGVGGAIFTSNLESGTYNINDIVPAPTIDDYNNSISDKNMYPVVPYGGSVTFYASSGGPVDSWVWHVDDVIQSNNYDNLTYAWTLKGYKSVTVTAINSGGTSSAITWNPYVKMEMAGAGDTISEMDESGYDNLMLGLEGDSPDFEVLLWGITQPYQVVVGNMFFAILFGIPMVMFWIRQGSLIIPSMFGIIIGVVMFAFMPPSFAATASAIIIMSILATLYNFYKERR